MNSIQIGDYVAWPWGQGLAQGVVECVCFEPTVIISKGKEIHRNGSQEDPALIIMSKNGVKVLKLGHEVQVTKVGSDDKAHD